MTHAVATGPITGTITVADGTTYDVTPYFVVVDPAHADELADLIGRHYEEHGHPQVEGDFIYNPQKDI